MLGMHHDYKYLVVDDRRKITTHNNGDRPGTDVIKSLTDSSFVSP
ncbi:hypothetical protein D082_05690 [Synechocystis sp. PCC 6714]|nr:hypothetical protein D082_05690 [Synechocystis sp. PCC 6714]